MELTDKFKRKIVQSQIEEIKKENKLFDYDALERLLIKGIDKFPLYEDKIENKEVDIVLLRELDKTGLSNRLIGYCNEEWINSNKTLLKEYASKNLLRYRGLGPKVMELAREYLVKKGLI